MKHIFQRLTVLLLIATILCAYLVPSAAAASAKEEMQQALVETAMAYYYKGLKVQYDNRGLTPQDRATGDRRSTSGEPPEYASDDHTLYTVCSDLCYNTILRATGYKLTGGSRNCLCAQMSFYMDPKSPGVVFHTGGKYGEKFDEPAVKAAIDLLQPGDVVVYSLPDASDGHSGVFVGDVKGDGSQGYFVNSGGKKIDLGTGLDVIEDESRKDAYGGGSILLSPIYSTAGGFARENMAAKLGSFTILRPADMAIAAGLSITAEGKARLAYRGIDVDRTTSAKQYDTVATGDEITVTVTVANHGKDDFKGVAVSEPLPTGAEVVASSVKGGSVSGGAVTGSLNVPAGGSATLEYTVKVTGKRGEDVSFPSGTVAGALTTRPKSIRIGGADWNDANAATFADLTKNKNATKIQRLNHNSDLDFVNAFYREFFGLDLDLPKTTKELRDSLLEWTNESVPTVPKEAFGGQLLWPKKGELTEQAKHIKEMILPEHMGGYRVYLRDTLTEYPEELTAPGRVMGFTEENYRPGDIFVGYEYKKLGLKNDFKPDVYVYLGNGKTAGVFEGAEDVTVEEFGSSVGRFMRESVFFVLRPRLAYDDVNMDAKAEAKPISFPDVKESDWFYGYVMDLAKEGIVGGMSDGTFQPAGTLTYGQALKLLVCALDKDVGNASSGHWASGYLSAAQSKGWISGSFLSENLDAWVSRLAFCQIAAKAKGLTAQPESNPFTDTSDPAVLALNKAGVIGGMGEGKFSPDTTLTRAQISKIIVELRKA